MPGVYPPKTNALDDKYNQLGRQGGFLGLPETDERTCPDGVGHYRHYKGGSIYFHPDTGAHEIHGAINAKWASLGREQSVLGYPTTDELVTPDKKGRYNHFQGGSIYWHPDTGAHEIHGAIRGLWATLGWEKSYLGYPLSDELATPGPLRCQRFQDGAILFTPDRGAREYPGSGTRYLIGIDKFCIAVTRSVHEDTDHVKLAVKVGDRMMLDIPVKHMGDVNDGEHIVGLYTDSLFEIPNLDTMVTFNYVIENIGDADYSAIEDGLKAAVAAGLTALEVPGGSTIAEIGSKIVHLFAANCDGPVAVDQISASGHLLDKWTTDNRVHSETRHYTYGSQTFCGASPEYDVTWSVVRL